MDEPNPQREWDTRKPVPFGVATGLRKTTQDVHDPFRGLSVPLFGYPAMGHISTQDPECVMQDFVAIVAYDEVCAYLAGDGSFGIVAERYAWDAKDCGFFLKPATIRDDHRC
jgi:hypothetical protein